MEEWKEYRLGDFVAFKTGKLNSNAAVENGSYPFFTCSPETLRINDYAFDQKAILLAGNNAEGNFNIKYYEGKFNAYQRTYVINPLDDRLDIRFLYYALSVCLQSFKRISQGTSTKFLTAQILNNFILNIPSLPTQQKIANILSSLDDKIEVNRRINDNLEQQAQALYKQWFVDFEFPNEEGNPYKSSGGKMIKSEMGEIPEKWHVGALKDIANVIMGQSPNGKSFNENGEGIVFYQGRTEFGSRYPSIRLYTTEPTRFAEPMSVLLSVRAPVGDINIATQRCCIGRGVASIDSKTGDNSYMYCCLKELRPQLDQYNGEGTVFGSINRKELEGLPLCIPNAKVIHEFNNLITGIEKQMFNLYQECSNLTTLRDTLLPRLMSGELSVNDVSTDLVC